MGNQGSAGSTGAVESSFSCGGVCSSCDGNDKLMQNYGLSGTEEFLENNSGYNHMRVLDTPKGSPKGSSSWFGGSSTPVHEYQGRSTPSGSPSKSVLGGLLDRLAGQTAEEKTLHYADGSMFEGQVLGGLRHGEGVYKSGSEQYTGQWYEDKQHGSGRQSWSDGRSYDGQFQHGRFSGLGKMVWQTQKGVMTYEGEYVEDLKHGMGKFEWPDGRKYDGEWLRGKRHGRGAYTTSKGEYKIGHWSEDRFLRWEVGATEQDNVNSMLR
mmetsp:Transcript_96125/g.170583  ORF Transcript_96125/g.170583 Transcript_96125/m.170583 type:complete len:266 (-) Transcript_96125:21-818(-)